MVYYTGTTAVHVSLVPDDISSLKGKQLNQGYCTFIKTNSGDSYFAYATVGEVIKDLILNGLQKTT